MRTFVLPLALAAAFATTIDAVKIGDVALCNGPDARTQPPTGAIVVDATGAYNGSYPSVSEGVAHLDPNTTAEQTIFVFPGVYHEQVLIEALGGPLVLQGYTCDTMLYAANEVTITHAKAQKDIPPEIKNNRNDLTSTLRLHSGRVKVYNLNVANTAGDVGQAVTVYNNVTDYGFYACNFTGYQDTVCAHMGLELFARSYINGAIDFIFGMMAQAWFESCDIDVIGKGYITANGRTNETNPSWYVFNNANVFGNASNGSNYLGRPWRTYARVVWQNSNLSDVINPEGWAKWDATSSTANVTFKEFNNYGPGAATDKRVDFSGQLNKSVEITDVLGADYASAWYVDTKYMTYTQCKVK